MNSRADDPALRHPQLVEAPYDLPDGVPDAVAKTVYAALDRDPDRRPLPHEIAGALEPVLAGQPPVRLSSRIRG